MAEQNDAKQSDHDEIEKTFRILKEGKTRIQLNENCKKVTLVLGNTGSGKSTVVQWIAGDKNDTLISKEENPDSGEFIIKDNNKRIGSSIYSQTTFPELVINKTEAYYDSPGFSDTRSTANDIANNYFIKRITDHCTDLKIVLVVNSSSVREGFDRSDFVTLLRRTTSLIKNVTKYENSFGIIVTKVDNLYMKKGTVLIPDEKIIENIAEYLKNVKVALTEKSQSGDVTKEEKAFQTQAITMLDIFLKHEKYPRIAIFRRPDEEGPLSGIEILQEGKQRVEKLFQHLKFTEKCADDFGYAISDTSKNDVNALVETINNKVWTDFSVVIERIKEHYEEVFVGMSAKINSLLENLESFDPDEKSALDLETTIKNAECALSQLAVQSSTASKLTDLPNAIRNNIVQGLGFNKCRENIENISTQVEYFEFLQKVSCKDLPTKPWSDLFERLETFFIGKKEQFYRVVTALLLEICNLNVKTMQNIGTTLEEYYRDKVLSTAIEDVVSDLNKANGMVSDWIGTDAKDLGEKIRDSEIAPITIVSDAFSFSKNAKFIECLNVSENIKIGDFHSKWMLPLRNTEKYITDLAKFMLFLQNVYFEFSQYRYQKDKSKYNVANIEDWGVAGKAQGIHIDQNNLTQFVKFFNGFSYVEELDVTEFHFKLLNQVLEKTLKTQVHSYQTESGKWVVRGDFVKFSDFAHLFLTYGKKQIDIFALNAVFIDTNIQAHGWQMSIIAPKWEIIGERVINLDGAAGVAHSPSKANSYSLAGSPRNPLNKFISLIYNRFTYEIDASGERGSHGGSGVDGGQAGEPLDDNGYSFHGMAGRPGSPGGNFFGVGEHFINVANLTISVRGGPGGPGQEGGDGKNGEDGSPATTNSPRKNEKQESKFISLIYNRYTYEIDASGERGSEGGRGGDGGQGGFGGTAGKVSILPLDDNGCLPRISTGSGVSGQQGEGGKGGLNGIHGKDLKGLKYYHYFLFFPVSESYEPRNVSSPSRRTRQQSGDEGTSTRCLESPNAPLEFQNIANIVCDYKNLLRGNLPDNFKTKPLLEFLNKLDKNKEIQSSYDTSALVSEFQALEKMHKGDKLEILPFYEALLNTTRQHEENSTAFSLVHAATLTRIITLKQKPSESYLIVDLATYLNNAKQNIDDLRDLTDKCKRLEVVNRHRDAYKTEIDWKIKEALQFIQSQLTPEIQDICKEVQYLTNRLMCEIKGKPNLDQNQLGEKASTWLNGIKLFGDVVGCFGYLGYAVGCVIKLGCQAAESTVLKKDNILGSVELRNDLLAIIKEVQIFSEEECKKSNAQGKKKSKTQKQGNMIVSKLKHGLNFVTSSIDSTCQTVLNRAQEHRPIEEATDVLEEQDQNHPPIHGELIAAFNNSVRQWDYCMNSLDSPSQVDLEVTQYQVQSQVENFKMRLQKVSSGLPVKLKMLHFLDKLEDATMTLIRIYSRIQSYQNQKELAQYIARISSPEELDEDGALVAELDLTIHSNLILEQHRSAVNAVAQHVFPFASYYLKYSTLVKSSFPLEGSVENLVDGAMEEVKNLHSKVMEYKSLITSHDKFLCTGWFTGDYQSAEPFYVWGNSENRSEISKLFRGEKVVMKADILKGILDKDAVKFNKIGINFNSDDPEIASDIRKKLAGFIVSATHLGNSYYKYGNKIYVISSGHQNITFSFEKDKSDEPVHKNVVYGKIGSGDLMLSPYAMWEFQLCPNSSKGDFEEKELEKYNDKVDLELIGYGSYLTIGASMSDLDVEPYYQVVQTL